jgi:hypothetical protein
MSTKQRPVLIIGYEETYDSPLRIDYEVLPISSLTNIDPDPTYDQPVENEQLTKLGLDRKSYIRTHKISWINVRNMRIESPLSNVKEELPILFNSILLLNQKWVNNRTDLHLLTFEFPEGQAPLSN